MRQTWYRFKDQADQTLAELHIDDFIGSWDDEFFGTTEVTAKKLVKAIAELSESVKTIRVHINSPGGDVFAAANIANALRAQAAKGRTVETMVDGLAASAASVIMMAGNPVRIADNAMVMVHNPWSFAIGTAADMRKSAEALDVIRDTIVATYRWHSELSDKELVALMDAETWMDADEAIANGFATEKVEGLKAAASIDPRAVTVLKVPERFADRVAALLAKPGEEGKLEPEPAPIVEASAKTEDVLTLCVAAGLDGAFALAVVKDGVTLPQAQARIAAEKEKRAAEDSRQDGIRALCKVGKCDDLAADLIAGGTSVEAARAVVAKVTAKVDRVEIDAGIVPDQGAGGKKVIDVQAVYAQRNQLRK